MELRHLRYFLAVAEQLNFTRAAKQLHIAQPPLTQQIKALEAELGVTLIDRSAYRIALTPAGKAFAVEVSRILGDVRNAALTAQRAEKGASGRVRVGFTESASFNPLVTSTFRRYRSRFPELEVSLEEHPSTVLAAALREDRLDVAFLRPPLADNSGLVMNIMEKEEMVVAMPRSDRLARRRSVKLNELANHDFILYPRALRPGLADAVVTACEQAGFRPKVCQYAPQLSSTINLVAASLGISIVPKSMQAMQARNVSYVRLSGLPVTAPLSIAYRDGERSFLLRGFLDIVREMVKGERRF
jgi:DNA-binding transcriptional LysR family regulator